MILFRTLSGFELDFTNLGITFVETSPFFDEETSSGYTFPFNTNLPPEFIQKFGLVTEDNVSSYSIKIDGTLILDDVFYEANLSIQQVTDLSSRLTLFYGREVLTIFDEKIADFSWPLIETGGDWTAHTNEYKNRGFPEVGHNFPILYRPEIASRTNYEDFLGYVNNRSSTGLFLSNSTTIRDGEFTVVNSNVAAPMPYVLEILRVGFGAAGLELRGEVFNSEFFRQVIFMPERFFEYYSDPAVRTVFKFTTQNFRLLEDGQQIDVYKRTFIPNKNGSYTVTSDLNIPKGLSRFFSLRITHGDNEVYFVETKDRAVTLNQTTFIYVNDEDFSPIVIELRLPPSNFSIVDYNTFYYDLAEGRLNTFPENYTLGEVLPDMTFREFFDAVRMWANIEATYYENSVYLNFMDSTLQKINYIDHHHIQAEPERTLSMNNLFKLRYSDNQEVWVDRTGQVFDDTNFLESEITTIEYKVLPVRVNENNGVITGEWPENPAALVFGLYSPTEALRPTTVNDINGQDLSLQDMFEMYHRHFLSFRANAETYKETVSVNVAEQFLLDRGVFKHNKKMLIKRLTRKRTSQRTWQVTIEQESF